MDYQEIIQALEAGAQANMSNRFRNGNLITLSSPGQVVMTGDLHGNIRNFEKLIRFANLEADSGNHLILHELIHGANTESPDQCHSYELVSMAARLKARFPNQIHYILGNHAMAQVTREEVLKNGQPMVRALNTGMYNTFGEHSGQVMKALDHFILSLPLAVRTDNRIWMSHSLPSMRHLPGFDSDIFQRQLTVVDMKSDPSLHALTWDRAHTPKCLELLTECFEADTFIVGHQPQPDGCSVQHDRMIILASDHNHGCYVQFELGQPYSCSELHGKVKPLAGLA